MGEDRQTGKDLALIDSLRRGAGALRWYVRSVMGDNHYRRYLAHQSAHHPGVAPVSESDYWRMRYRNQDANPQGRCC